MKNILLSILFLGGCATLSENEFYHRFNLKPTIDEKDLGDDLKLETISNPYDVSIVATIDCDNELAHRTLVVKSNGKTSFNTESDTNYNCAVVRWVVK